jgi:hypothetical protein
LAADGTDFIACFHSFVVQNGLSLGEDFVLYRGTPERFHAEYALRLRAPGEGKQEAVMDWTQVHLAYRLIQVGTALHRVARGGVWLAK